MGGGSTGRRSAQAAALSVGEVRNSTTGSRTFCARPAGSSSFRLLNNTHLIEEGSAILGLAGHVARGLIWDGQNGGSHGAGSPKRTVEVFPRG